MDGSTSFIMQNPTRMSDVSLVFATPRKLPRARNLKGRVVVLDLAFASEASGKGFEKTTLLLIQDLGDRLAAWVDHHDHAQHEAFRDDPRFVLSTKAEHGACPEMINPQLVKAVGAIDTIVCHTDFDGLASAAKWLRHGVEPYEGCDKDALAIDTRLGTPSAVAETIDRALRARPQGSRSVWPRRATPGNRLAGHFPVGTHSGGIRRTARHRGRNPAGLPSPTHAYPQGLQSSMFPIDAVR